MMMYTRRAMLRDINAIYELGNAEKALQISDDVFLTIEDIRYCIENQKGVFLVGYLKNKLVGFIYGSLEFPTTGNLMYICIDEKFRRNRHGTNLYVEWVCEMKNFGLQQIYLLSTNPTCEDFFRSRGFKEEENSLVVMTKRMINPEIPLKSSVNQENDKQ